MKKILTLLAAATPLLAAASGTVDFLEVDNDVVLFSTTDAKQVTSPSCMTSENVDLWSLSLASDSGRAMYSLILTSMAKGSDMQISVESAQDCAVSTGYERANKVNLVAVEEPQEPIDPSPPPATGAKTVALYKGDGVTRLGTVVGVDAASNAWHYVDAELSTSIKAYTPLPNTNNIFYFTGSQCTGTVYMSKDVIDSSIELEDNKYLEAIGSIGLVNVKSRLTNSDYCSEYVSSRNVYRTRAYTHPVCGTKPCLIREE